MEDQSLRDTLKNILKARSQNSSAYRTSLLIYESILQSTSSIPNFNTLHANNDSNFALFIFGSVYKLLFKEDALKQQNFDSMLILISNTLPRLNITVLKQANLLKGLQKRIYELIYSKIEKTPLAIRLAISILHQTFVNTDNISQDNDSKDILCALFNSAVESHRTNILSKETGKMLCHLVQNENSFAKILSWHVTNSLQTWDASQLFLNNVREVILHFDLQLINNVVHRVINTLPHFSSDREEKEDEDYLTQTYFFLEKSVSKLNSSILEGICEKLINFTPSLSKSEKISYCYLQALHSAFEAFFPLNEKRANKYLSSIISVFQEFIAKGGKVEKHAVSLLKSILSNCIRKSLWFNAEESFDLQSLALEEDSSHNFGKVICMMKQMLSMRYPNHKSSGIILSSFFDSLEISAFPFVEELIQSIVEFKDQFDDSTFRGVFHAIFGSMSIKQICKMYPISVQGDIGDESFQMNTNLWIVSCVEKYEGEEDFSTYIQQFLSSHLQLFSIVQNTNLTPIRKQAYESLHDLFWRTLKIFCRKVNHRAHSFEAVIELIQKAIPFVSNSTIEHIGMALQILCSRLYEQEYNCNWSGKLIGILSKKLKTMKNTEQLLKALKGLSTIADHEEYLNSKFDFFSIKLLIELDQINEGSLKEEQKVQKFVINLQILIALTNGIDFSDPSIVYKRPQNFHEKYQKVQPSKYKNRNIHNLVGKDYLGKYSREEIVKILIEKLIKNKNFQKKGYKYIFEVISLLSKGEITEIIQIIQSSDHKIQTDAKRYRLAILKFLWDQNSRDDDQIEQALLFIKNYLHEILIALREKNERTRKQANVIFESFCQKIISIGAMEEFIEIICAGLVSDTVEMKIATINGLGTIFMKKYEVDVNFSLKILETVMLLFGEKRPEIYKAIIQYSKRFVFTLEKSRQINEVLPILIDQLFKDEASKLEHRSILKHFLLKLSKKHGREEIEKLIPKTDKKLLSNAIKTENRERKKKKKLRILRRQEMEKRKKEQQNETSSDEENEGENEMEQEGDMDAEDNNLQELDNSKNLLLKYDLDKENFHFEQQKLNIQLQKKNMEQDRKKQIDGVSFGEGGKMIVRDEYEFSRERATRKELQEDEQEEKNGYVNVKKKKKLNDIHIIKESGDSFKSKRAGGDVKHRDKPQPYAFIQFNSKALNKRFKKRAEQVFDKIFEKHEGGLKGIKSKIASRMH